MKERRLEFFRMPTLGSRQSRSRYRGESAGVTAAASDMVSVVTYTIEPGALRYSEAGVTATILIKSESVHLSRVERRYGFLSYVSRPSPVAIRKELTASLKRLRSRGVDRLDVIIDSHGGVTATAVGIMQALCKWRGQKRCLIDGSCDSAATLIAFGVPWLVTITRRSSVLVHAPQAKRYIIGKRTRRVKAVEDAEPRSERMFERVYRHKSQRKKTIVREWMAKGRRFTAAEATVAGLCDEMLPLRTDWEVKEPWQKES